MKPVGKVCEELAGAMTAAEPIAPLAWGIIRDDANIPLYLVFFAFGPDNIKKIDDVIHGINPAGKIATESVLYRVGSVGESIYGGMEAAEQDLVHWAIGKDGAGRELYLIGFARGTLHVPKMNQLLERIRQSGALADVPADLGIPRLDMPEMPPDE